MSNKSKKQSGNSRRFRKSRNRNVSVGKAVNSIVKREISYSSVLKIPSGASSAIGYVAWGGAIGVDTSFADLAAVYNQFRLCGVQANFVPFNFVDNTSPTYGEVTGIVLHDPTSQLSLAPSNIFNLSESKWSKLFASGSFGNTSWKKVNYRAQLSNVMQLNNAFAGAVAGCWSPTDQATDLAGNTIFAASTRDAATSTSDVTVLQVILKFLVEFRQPKGPDVNPESNKFAQVMERVDYTSKPKVLSNVTNGKPEIVGLVPQGIMRTPVYLTTSSDDDEKLVVVEKKEQPKVRASTPVRAAR